jgi:uncharacterized protein
MKSSSREFQIFVKPAGALCNLSCSYCYYLKKKSLYSGSKDPMMPESLLEKYVIQHISASTDNLIFFSWHGGEPMIAGVDFYKTAVRLQKKHLPSGKRILNGIQTNGTLIDEEWCRFFADENFVIGISIDGPGELHDQNRRDQNGHSSLEKVMNGLNYYRDMGLILKYFVWSIQSTLIILLLFMSFSGELGLSILHFCLLLTDQMILQKLLQ